MGQKKLQNRFYCKVSGSIQITIPVRLQKTLNIEAGDILKLDLFEDLSVDFCRDEKESAAEHAQPAKNKRDKEKADAERKKK